MAERRDGLMAAEGQKAGHESLILTGKNKKVKIRVHCEKRVIQQITY